MDLLDFMKVYGPLGMGWILAGYLLKVLLGERQADIESRVKLAVALETLTNLVKANAHD